MTQEVYGLVSNSGDGSGTIMWFKNKVIANYLVSSDYYNRETFIMNEGYINKTLTFPENLDLEKCGFIFSDDRFSYVIEDEEEDY